MNYTILTIGVGILIYDAVLAAKGKTTISQWCQKLFPTWVDWIIGITGWIVLCFVNYFWPEFDFALAIFIAGFWGHIWLANRERYKN